MTFTGAATLQVTDGSTAQATFIRPVNAVELSTSVALICGEYVFEVYSDTSDSALSAAWISVSPHASTPGSYTFDVDSTVDNTLLTTQATQDFTVHVKAYLQDYTSVVTYTSKVVQIVAATCDCTALAWDDATISTPSIGVNIGSTETIPLPVANTAARSTNAAFDNCYQSSNDCGIGGSFQAGSIKYDDGVTVGGTTLPSWITFSSTGNSVQTVVISPPDGTYNGAHTLYATMTTDNGPDKTYTAITFTVTCTLTSYVMPATPTDPTFDLGYIVYAVPTTIDLSTLAYTEAPTCGYTITTAITWTGL